MSGDNTVVIVVVLPTFVGVTSPAVIFVESVNVLSGVMFFFSSSNPGRMFVLGCCSDDVLRSIGHQTSAVH